MVVAIHELRRIVKTNVGVFNVNGAMTNIQIIQELNYSIYMNCVKAGNRCWGTINVSQCITGTNYIVYASYHSCFFYSNRVVLYFVAFTAWIRINQFCIQHAADTQLAVQIWFYRYVETIPASRGDGAKLFWYDQQILEVYSVATVCQFAYLTFFFDFLCLNIIIDIIYVYV